VISAEAVRRRAPPHAPGQEIARFSDINDVAEPGTARAVA
jgi:hypothetical protein